MTLKQTCLVWLQEVGWTPAARRAGCLPAHQKNNAVKRLYLFLMNETHDAEATKQRFAQKTSVLAALI